jgi:ribose transport system ATP-binding protein
MTKPLVEMIGICKEFPGVRALTGVDFRLEPGEVHVLFGENGAGKSTLISILAGVYPPTSGSIRIEGEDATFRSVHDAAQRGVGVVFQEFSLVPTLTVFENIYLGREPRKGLLVNRRAMIRGAERLFGDLAFDIDIRRRVSELSRAEQQMIEIAKALQAKARILIFDEPTASLTEKETRKLFSVITKARDAGVGIIYISHRIQEFVTIADRISVLRDGRLIRTVPARGASESDLVELMTGRAIDQIYPNIAGNAGETLLALRDLRSEGVAGVSLDVRAGEVLGVAGLIGSGKSRVWRSALGLQPVVSGRVILKGRDVTNRSTRALLREGLFYLPPDRMQEGLLPAASARDNLRLALLDRPDASTMGLISPRRTGEWADRIGARVDISKRLFGRVASTLSGGNQQKILFGRGFGRDYDVYVLDEPTVGVDVGTRAALYLLIKELAESGKAVVIISSDLPEVLHLSHRLVVFTGGRISAELAGEDITEGGVLAHFFTHAELRHDDLKQPGH